MPATITTNPSARTNNTDVVFDTSKYNYDYPEGLDLAPDSDTHQRLVSEILQRAQHSYTTISYRHSSWRQVDRTLRAYGRISDLEKNEDNKDTRREGQDKYKIVIPESYATLDTIVTYLMTAFLKDPIFKYEGVGPEDKVGALMMQHIVHQHVKRNKVALALHTQWRDSLAYGIGVVSPIWQRDYGMRTTRVLPLEEDLGNLLADFESYDNYKNREEVMLYEGNKLLNIDPYRYLPDPTVASHEVQDGEFCGFVTRFSLMQLLRQEATKGSDLFNVKYLKQMQGRKTSVVYGDDSGRESDKTASKNDSIYSNPVDVICMYVDMIPADWGLGSSKEPEKWYFELAADTVIIKAKPLGLDHNKVPIVVASPDFDGYSVLPTARLELVSDLQTVMDFLYTSRIANIRKSINDMWVVDPSIININDLENPEPGKLVRVRRANWGQAKIDAGIKQLVVNDTTQGHIGDTSYLAKMMQQVSGATDSMQGIVERRGPRVSATESRGARLSGLSRLEKIARIISMQSMSEIGYMFASHTQQLMSQATYLKVSGDMERVFKEIHGVTVENGRLPINPLDVLVNYDIEEFDNSIPGTEDVDTWSSLFQTIMQSGALANTFDIGRIFSHIAVQMGAKNVNDFIRQAQPQVMPDEQVMEEVDRGNMMPLDLQGEV